MKRGNQSSLQTGLVVSKIIEMGVSGTDMLRNSKKTSLADVSSESLEKSAGARLRWTLKNLGESFPFSGEQ